MSFKANDRIITNDQVPLLWNILPGTKGRVISDDLRLIGEAGANTRYTVELDGGRIVYLGTHHMQLIGANG